jgi:chromosome segregation ATPase
MVIQASYGYKQSQVYNINCKVAPLLELIRRNSYFDICKLLQARQEQIIKEITEIIIKTQAKEDKLNRLENPVVISVEENKDTMQELNGKKKSTKDLKKQPFKSSHAAAESKKAEEEKKKAEEEKKKAEEEKKKAEEEKKKAEEAKKKKEDSKKQPKKEEIKELSLEEIKAQKIENQKIELRKQISDNNTRKLKLEEKLEMIKNNLDKLSVMPSEIDLVDQNSVRKFLGTREEEIASKILNTRSIYTVVVIENDTFNPFEINGFCIRTIEEDTNFVEDPEIKGKKPKTAKKK